jgi:hypothetical protein
MCRKLSTITINAKVKLCQPLNYFSHFKTFRYTNLEDDIPLFSLLKLIANYCELVAIFELHTFQMDIMS